jgi:hypothetical protein
MRRGLLSKAIIALLDIRLMASYKLKFMKTPKKPKVRA